MEKTIPQQLAVVCDKYSSKAALRYKTNNEWKDITYNQLQNKVNSICYNLQQENIPVKSTIAILSENRWEWLVTDLGIMMSGNITVPLHNTNAVKVNNYILKHSKAKILFISEKELSELNDGSLIEGTIIEKIVVYGNSENDHFNIDVKNFTKYLKSGDPKSETIGIGIDPNDPACILYTSGTTGNPKGVPLTHQNLLSNMQQVLEVIDVYETDTFLSFLPYSHALEHTAGFLLPLLSGSTISLAESVNKLGENLKEVQPTIMITVPRIFERVYDKIMDKVRAGSSIKQKLFHWALTTNPGSKSLKRTIAEKLVFKKIQANVGGRIRFFVSGGSSLTKEIAEFFSITGLKVIEGYGLTETSPIITCNRIENTKFGTVGQPVPNTKIRVSEEGELLVKGPQVMKGYLDQPEATKDAFEDGWFKTGDIVETGEDGFITIVDRKKEIIVLSTGQNVAPQFVENHLSLNKYVQQSMVFGNNLKVLNAFIVPDFEELKIWLGKKGEKKKLRPETIIEREDIKKLIKREIKKALKDLGRHEQVGRFKLLPRAFSQNDDELTPTLKLKRRVIIEHNK